MKIFLAALLLVCTSVCAEELAVNSPKVSGVKVKVNVLIEAFTRKLAESELMLARVMIEVGNLDDAYAHLAIATSLDPSNCRIAGIFAPSKDPIPSLPIPQ